MELTHSPPGIGWTESKGDKKSVGKGGTKSAKSSLR